MAVLSGMTCKLACKLLVASVACLPTVAAATAWQGVTRDIDKALVYVDADSMRDEGGTRTARVLFDYLEPQHRPGTFNQWFQSVEAEVTVRCANRSYERKGEVM